MSVLLCALGRAVKSGMEKRVWQELISESPLLKRSRGETVARLRDVSTWHCVVGCSLHDGRSEHRRGCFDGAQGRGVCHDAFAVSEPLRRGYSL